MCELWQLVLVTPAEVVHEVGLPAPLDAVQRLVERMEADHPDLLEDGSRLLAISKGPETPTRPRPNPAAS